MSQNNLVMVYNIQGLDFNNIGNKGIGNCL